MKKFYITTAIAYVNAPPHIGFALELLQADVLARFHRQQGDETFFLTGTDEHGTKIVRTAASEGKTPQELTDEHAPEFEQLATVLQCSNDDFIRTTDQERHWPGVVEFWKKLVAVDAIYRDTYKGFYCVGCEAYVVEGDLVDGKCSMHNVVPEAIEEENYFFRLSRYQDKIKTLIETDQLRIVPSSRRKELLSFIEREGLKDISFSRPKEKLPWGVPVPGDEDHVIYVWADALPNYITAIGYGRDEDTFNKWWPADVHVIGKDILRFHAAIWPAMLLAVGLELPSVIFTHGFITSEGKKMSKSTGNVIDPFALVEHYGVDAVRYYLLREIPSWEDGDYSEERFRDRYNADLANGIGNLTSRIITLAAKNNVSLPSKGASFSNAKEAVKEAMEAFRFHDALAVIWKEIALVDGFLENSKPWELASNEGRKEELREILESALWSLQSIADLLQPFLPQTSERIIEAVKQGSLSESLFPRL